MKNIIIKSAAILLLIFILKFSVTDVSASRYSTRNVLVGASSRICSPAACMPGTWNCRCRNVRKIFYF